MADTELSIVSDDKRVEVIDPALGSWIMRFEPMTIEADDIRSRGVAVGVANGLLQAIPGLHAAISAMPASLAGGTAMRLVFSPEMQRGLADGTYRLASGALPMAVDGAGRFVEVGRISTSAGASAAGTLGLGALAAVSWPVVVAAGVATAAAMAQQRWLERTFGELSAQLDRIETRMRDDDLGTLDATDELMLLIASVGVTQLPQQLREELAVARRQVEGIYASRRRFVERLKQTMERDQTAHEEKTGERSAWAGDVAKHLSDGSAIDELVVFVRAMVTRARVTAVTAGVLADDGASIASLRLVNDLQEALRVDYWDLQNRLRALARATPDEPRWRQLVTRSGIERAAAHARALHDSLESAVGERLPERDQGLSLELPAEWTLAS